MCKPEGKEDISFVSSNVIEYFAFAYRLTSY